MLRCRIEGQAELLQPVKGSDPTFLGFSGVLSGFGRGVHDDLKPLGGCGSGVSLAVLGADIKGGVLGHLTFGDRAEFCGRITGEEHIVQCQIGAGWTGGKAPDPSRKAARVGGGGVQGALRAVAQQPGHKRRRIAVEHHGIAFQHASVGQGHAGHAPALAFDPARGNSVVQHRAYSEPLAVLTGDSLIVLAFDVLAEAAGNDPMRALQMIRVLSRRTGMPDGICAGQGWESEAKVNLSAYHRAKTGALFIAATQMGAIAAGHEHEPWEELGARIGEAFQVADDLRDALYDAQMLGKPAGQDAVHSRPNAVAELGVQGAIGHLKDILSGVIASIPACPGEGTLADMVRRYAESMTPVAPAFSQAQSRG